MDSAHVPALAQLAKPSGDGLRETVGQSVMEAHAQRKPAKMRQWNVVARDIDPLESIPLLELAQTVVLLAPIAIVVVDQVGDPLVSAGPHRLRKQCICWRFILMLHL